MTLDGVKPLPSAQAPNSVPATPPALTFPYYPLLPSLGDLLQNHTRLPLLPAQVKPKTMETLLQG